jgi:tetratricopeptide (TPR) repeat protein
MLAIVSASPLVKMTPTILNAVVQTATNPQRKIEADNLYQQAEQHYRHSQFREALKILEQVVVIYREVGEKEKESITLSSMGVIYRNLGEYAKAQEYYQQALKIRQQIGDKAGEGTILGNIGAFYYSLGDYNKALKYYQQALGIHQQIGNKDGEGTTLNNLGLVYHDLGEYPKALELLQQALAIRQTVNDKLGESTTRHNLGAVYHDLGEYPKALELLQQALAIRQYRSDKTGEGSTLNNLGVVYRSLGKYPQALNFLDSALVIRRQVDDKAGEGTTLGNIAKVFHQQNKPELALVFYKQSVNVTETIRQDLRQLPEEQQKSFTETVRGRYRSLANILISQGRILEAQQVLELLKLQEIRDYTRKAKANNQTSGIVLNSIEEQIIKSHGTLIEFGQKVAECRTTQCSELSQLNDQLQALTTQYNQSIATLKQIIAVKIPAITRSSSLRDSSIKSY